MNIPFWPPKARPMKSRSSVRAVRRNAVLKVFPIILSCYSIGCYAEVRVACSHFGKSGLADGVPLPFRSIGIMRLGENCEIIYGAQLVTGKILETKQFPLVEFTALPAWSSKEQIGVNEVGHR